jgi:CHAT domain-containing protein
MLLEDMGDFPGALKQYEEALTIRRMALPPDHEDYVATLNNIAVLLKTIGKWAEARPFYEEALQNTLRAYGPNHIRTATAFANTGTFLHTIGELELARDYLRKSLAIQQRTGGGDQPGLGSTLHNLASLLTDMGEFALARQHFKAALARIRSAQYGQPWQEASTLRAMAWLHEKQADHSGALSLLQEAGRVQDSILGNAFAAGSERQRKASVIFPFVVLHELLTVVCQHFASDPGAVCAAFEVLLRRKGIIAEALAAQRDGVLGNRHPELRPALAALSACRAEIARLSLDGPGATDLAEHQRRIARLHETRERLEADLAQSIPEIRLAESFRTVDVAAVAAAVPAGHALVEFARFSVCSFRGRAQVEDSRTMRYLAFVLRAGEPESLQLFDLGDAALIETGVASLRATIGASSTVRDFGPEEKEDAVHNDRAARALRQAVFDPVRKAVGDCRRLILSPDGVLNFLPFEILPAEENRLLIDQWHFSYLAAARDILACDSRAGATPSAALVAGDPDYDLAVESVAAADVQQPEVNDLRSARIRRDLDRGFGRFEPLLKARREAERIAELLGVKEHLDADVTKDLVASCRSPRILHLATHGFFLPSSSVAASRATLSSDRLAILSQRAENPLLRSGLALAGANTWRKSQPLPAKAGNGILTAEDVTGLDLLDTDLVVLSACETGLGTEDFCEGILGFRRSFGLAGARTIVMSLWKVPDDQTQELMVDFYRRILRGTPKAKALREAQLEIKARHPEPFFWGAFICQGDPGPLLPA